jgi:putative membrane protein
MDIILLLKILHILGFVAWFTGLFYLVRLYVYHAEAMDEPEPKQGILRAQYEAMESRVYKSVCTPAMIITWVCGLAMLYFLGGDWLKDNHWVHMKFIPLLMLSGFQGVSKKWMRQLKDGTSKYTAQKFRTLNWIPVVLLIVIVCLAVFRF